MPTKSDLRNIQRIRIARKIANDVCLPGKVVDAVIERLLEELRTTFLEGKEVEFRKFGTFRITRVRPRNLYNLRGSGEKRPVPGKTTVRFYASDCLEEALNCDHSEST